MDQFAINLESIKEAHARIGQYVHNTPVLTSSTLDSLSGRNLYFKCEFMQKTGSFKARGACNAVFKNDYSSVVTHSSGNHGQALAWAAKMRGIPAHVIMPNNAPICKQLAVSGYSGIITFCEPNQAAREKTSEYVMNETGASFVHPYNNVDVMSGQGTIALELLNEIEHLDAIIVPIGGGGMCSGITIAAKSINPSIKIIAAEPAEANDAFRSKSTGVLTPNNSPPSTIADGLKTNLGELTWPVVRDAVDDVITVSEEEICAALRLVWERMKCVIEPSAAVGVAVALSDQFRLKWGGGVEGGFNLQNVGVVLCGGNIDLDNLSGILKS